MNHPLDHYQRAVLAISTLSLSCALDSLRIALEGEPLDVRSVLAEAKKDAELALEYLDKAADIGVRKTAAGP